SYRNPCSRSDRGVGEKVRQKFACPSQCLGLDSGIRHLISHSVMAQELTSEQIQQVLQGISVPPQPQIMVDLQMEQFMPNPDLKVIAKLISQDPGLSGALLKIVNSPYFGLANKVSSIQRAVNLLGSRSVINMINAL